MYLPNEIILHILKSLERCDLKSARLISKAWTAFAAELLFDQAYVSVHPDNLHVFNSITQHPILSKCVKTLRYDAVDFSEACTKDECTRFLWSLTRRLFSIARNLDDLEVPSSDPQLKSWIDAAMADDGKFDLTKCKDYDFINHGYNEYQRYAALQRAHFGNGIFVETLAQGLQKLKNLSRVVMDNRWRTPRQVSDGSKKMLFKRLNGSPLARKWNVFHGCPPSWSGIPQCEQLTSLRGTTEWADHYWAITCALVRSQRKIQTFELSPSYIWCVPAHVFDRSQMKNISYHGLDVVAFSGLRHLKISIAPDVVGISPGLYPDMDGLQCLLGSMHNLELLDLRLPRNIQGKPAFHTYDQIFPKEGHWSQLTTLSLCNLASSAADLLTLLTGRMPNLRDFQLGSVELLTGTWEGVIECMMQSMHLRRFFPLCHKNAPGALKTQLWHSGGSRFLKRNYPHFNAIRNYVENGGRHPCLRSDQPDSAAHDYVTDDLKRFCKTTALA